WQGSHHDFAMQHANANSVLGDFDNASFRHGKVISKFYQKDGHYLVRTDGPDGKLQDFEIKYTFGVYPLQQYLVELDGGHVQALSIAWDARPEEEGGQRWFHLYPDETISHDDVLHWTRPSQNWNSRCAACHSTNLQKNYDPVARTFATRWSEINVSCESCHGPASEHVTWANRGSGWNKHRETKGLRVQLDERDEVSWPINKDTGSATRSRARSTSHEIEVCAPCHARRSAITDDYVPGEPLLDHYLPSLLDEGMYFPDGQIDEEVYVYGSFLQSRMHHAGVTCSDCHEPHSLQLRKPGNGVCLQCHAAKTFDSKSHHFHEAGSSGASCAECHMPPRTYMVVDPRHDHSIRIPRPDLSVELGTPNACNNCHADKSPEWAAQQVNDWYGHKPRGHQRYAGALAAARNAEPAAGRALAELVRDAESPDIARATALSQLASYLDAQTLGVLTDGLYDADPLVRSAAVRVLEQAPAVVRVQLAFPLLEDKVRAVRIEAARVLASIPAGDLDRPQRELLEHGIREYVAAQMVNAERPEAQVNLGNLYAAQGAADKAEAAYATAMQLEPGFIPAYVNLADLYRQQGRDAEGVRVLREAIRVVPDAADAHHALGLALIRQQRADTAVEELRRAATLAPGNARYIYVYAVALNSTGKPDAALLVLQGAHNRFPYHTDILGALVAFHREAGNADAAASYAEKLQALTPAR
ncbi:MAG: ammonia-forming cytochrome c nitrite reductase subunit c552, partial [Gammaproteobacteria bacterium]|nr:ammonia-forming cytochrome c nitrite reductase subunit c552 [Gammaproteobacteria bacterium]